jgi:hypothetical protein
MGRSNTLRRGRPAPSESRPSSFQGPGAVGSFARYYAARSLRQGRAGARKRGQVPGSSPLEFGASPQPIPGAHDGRTPRSAPPPLRGAQMPQGSPPHTSGRGALGRSDRWAPFRLEDTGPAYVDLAWLLLDRPDERRAARLVSGSGGDGFSAETGDCEGLVAACRVVPEDAGVQRLPAQPGVTPDSEDVRALQGDDRQPRERLSRDR